MADPMHFFMAFEPPTATQQEHKVSVGRDGKIHWYPSAEWEKARDALWARLEPNRPDKPLEGPVMLSVTWCFPNDGHADGEPHTAKPDTDNLDKGLKDIMTKLGWWNDDCQVFSEQIVKVWSRIPGVRIDIETL